MLLDKICQRVETIETQVGEELEVTYQTYCEWKENERVLQEAMQATKRSQEKLNQIASELNKSDPCYNKHRQP